MNEVTNTLAYFRIVFLPIPDTYMRAMSLTSKQGIVKKFVLLGSNESSYKHTSLFRKSIFTHV
jgi:hypothetical protein